MRMPRPPLEGSSAPSQPRRWLCLAAGAGLACTLLPRRDSAPAGPSSPGGTMANAELRRAEELGSLCSGANPVGLGLRGEYYREENLAGTPMLVRVDPVIDFDAGLDWPSHGDAGHPRSVRWTGWVKAPLSGRYRFHLDAPGAQVSVSRQVLVGAGDEVELAAGRYHPVSLALHRLPAGPGRIRLEWTAPHGARFLVSRALLFPPTESVTTPDGRPRAASGHGPVSAPSAGRG